MSRISEMTLEDAINEYKDGFCVLVDDGKRITLTNSDEEYCGKMSYNDFCKQFISDRVGGHPLDCYKIPLSVIEEKYARYLLSN